MHRQITLIPADGESMVSDPGQRGTLSPLPVMPTTSPAHFHSTHLIEQRWCHCSARLVQPCHTVVATSLPAEFMAPPRTWAGSCSTSAFTALPKHVITSRARSHRIQGRWPRPIRGSIADMSLLSCSLLCYLAMCCATVSVLRVGATRVGTNREA